MLLRAILCGGVWNGFLLGKAKKEDVPCRFCGKKDGVRDLPATGLGAFFGMVGCLELVALAIRTPGLLPLVIWLLFILNGALVLIRWTLLVAGLFLIMGTLEMSESESLD